MLHVCILTRGEQQVLCSEGPFCKPVSSHMLVKPSMSQTLLHGERVGSSARKNVMPPGRVRADLGLGRCVRVSCM